MSILKSILLYFAIRWVMMVAIKFQQDPIERVTVAVEADMSKFFKQVEEGVGQAKKDLEGLGDSADDVGDKTGGAGQRGGASMLKMGATFGFAAAAATKLLDIVLKIALAIPNMVAQFAQQAVGVNAQFETFETQFQTLLGSADAAKERLEELAQFGVETPFELPEIVEASRTLQTFGGDVLAAEENLRLIGDAAAGVNQPFNAVAFWVGRMYDAIQSGRPFGEAAARLQEMAILTGPLRAELERMQKTGKDGAEIFAFFSEQVGDRFTGNMERLSQTFGGILSNIADFRGELVRVAGAPIFEMVKGFLADFLQLLNENEPQLVAVGQSVSEIIVLLASIPRGLFEGLDPGNTLTKVNDGLQSFIGWLQRVVKPAQAFIGQVIGFLKPLGELIITFIKVHPLAALLAELFGRLDEALLTAAQIMAFARAGAEGLLAGLQPLFGALGLLGQAVQAAFRGEWGEATRLATQGIEDIKNGIFDLDAASQAAGESILKSWEEINAAMAPDEVVEKVEEAADDMNEIGPSLAPPDAVAQQLDKFAQQMIDAQERRQEQLEDAEQQHGEKMQKIMAGTMEKIAKAQQKGEEKLAELAEETEKKRLEIIEDARKALAELEEDTDRELSEKREAFDQQELRETEDHLREMRRLAEDHLLQLEGAVTARDARAVRDLQARFALEQTRREEDFSIGQSRERQDVDRELTDVRETEARKRAEILSSQAEQLEDLRLHEEERRAEIIANRETEIAELQQKRDEDLARERERYAEQQQTIDSAYARQLETIAKAMADQAQVTEEGAREVLETLNNVFGVGGDIDKMMENFARRRAIKAEVEVEFKRVRGDEDNNDDRRDGRPGDGPTPFNTSGFRSGATGFAEFAQGGQLLATKPTVALFGEAGPEFVQFTPMSELSAGAGSELDGRLQIEFSGSAPPGFGPNDRDQVASVLLQAFRDAGVT